MRFHAVYWPAFLMSAGIAVPRRIFSHGFLFNRGEKMSKSVGNVIDPFALADAYGVDPLRYFLLREVPFGQDGNYSHEAIVNRINADLANDLGNLAQRSLTMIGAQVRRRAAAAGRVQRSRPGHPRATPTRMIGKARDAMADAATASGAQRRLGGGRRRQPLFRRRGAVGAGQDRSGTAGHGALRDRRGVAPGRDPGAAVHAGLGRQAARSSGGAGTSERAFRTSSAAHHRIAAGRKACRRRRRFSRVMSSRRRKRRNEQHADRQPLPSRFSRLCRRARRRGRPRARGRHRAHGHDLDPGAAPCRGAGHRRALSRRVLLGRHASALRPRGTRRRPRPISSRARATRRSSRSAKPASTTTTTTRRATRRSAASARTSQRRARPACRWSSIPARPTTTRRGFSKRKRGRAPSRPCCIASPAVRDLARRAIALGLFISFTGILTFKNSDGAARHRRGLAGRPHPGRDRRAVSRAGPVSRQAQRAGLCGRNRESAGGNPRRRVRRDRAADHRQFLPPVQQGAAAAQSACAHEPRMTLKFTILGCGSSAGVPRPALGLGRTAIRTTRKTGAGAASLLVERHGPTGRHARARRHARRICASSFSMPTSIGSTACSITHEHADHTHGIDDLRSLFIKQRRRVDVYLDEPTAAMHAFTASATASNAARQRISADRDRAPPGAPASRSPSRARAAPIAALPFLQEHGDIASLGFRFGNLAYSCDLSGMPAESLARSGRARRLDRRRAALPAASEPLLLDDALAWIERLKPRRADPDQPACRPRLRGAAAQAAAARRAGLRRHAGASRLRLAVESPHIQGL